MSSGDKRADTSFVDLHYREGDRKLGTYGYSLLVKKTRN